jgi:acyl-CoA dehydrogenase
MSEARADLVAATRSLFAARCPAEVVEQAKGSWSPGLWEVLAGAELPWIGTPETFGGAGGDLGDAVAVLQIAGNASAPVPLAETMLAGWLLSAAGITVPREPLTVVLPDRRVSYGRAAAAWVLVRHDRIHLVDPGEVTDGTNLAGEPRGHVARPATAIRAEAPLPRGRARELVARAELGRAALIAGAVERALSLTIRYARERIQFGRPIGHFQAVQRQAAELAGETAAAQVAVQAAALAAPEHLPFAAAAARVRAGQAARTGARIAHQLHGAIGLTDEHVLKQTTLRLWAWQHEDGAEATLAADLGRRALRAGPDGLWPLLTAAYPTNRLTLT